MLTYQDVVTVDLSRLTTAAVDWDRMADAFKELERVYKSAVESSANEGEWVGVSASAASTAFTGTRKQFAAAQVEARAIASILRDAHGQFVRLIGRVKDVVEDARKGGVAIDSEGRASRIDAQLVHVPEDHRYVRAPDKSEIWERTLKQAVQAVDDADQGVKLALHDAAGIKSLFQEAFDAATGRAHEFNADAVGDIEVVEARLAREYADEILAGKRPSDLAEWQRLMRDNSDDRDFSRTFLNSLGPDATLKLSNKLHDLAYFDDTKSKQAYLNINGGIADSLASATRVPQFKNADGKPLRFGTTAYTEAFEQWKKTPEATFYNEWRTGLQKHGDDEYDLRIAGERHAVGIGHDQKVQGYQTLATLLQHGDGYSGQFLSDITDDMIAAETKDPDIWDLRGTFEGKDGWFANDPVDATLGVMARDPETAAGYLDPGTESGKEHYEYLLGKDGRDWDVVDTVEYRKSETYGRDVEDADSRHGLGLALTAAATGMDPTDPNAQAVGHSEVNDRVFKHSLEYLSKQGDDLAPALRDDLAKIMINHGDEVYTAMSDQSGTRTPLDQEQVQEITKQISRNRDSYVILTEGMNYAIVDAFDDKTRAPEDTLNAAGYAVGFMEEARYNALQGDLPDMTWDKAWSYHLTGAALNFIPGVGDIAQRGADMVTTKWIEGEMQRYEDGLVKDSKTTYQTRQDQLNALAHAWHAENSEWAENEPGYSKEEGIYNRIRAAANDGNDKNDGVAGAQER
ncbi:hypothetical protein QCN29_03205 [Streptomyces sp. HNM0663]|uniref:AG2 protein n=1 Tax=Streptomyces chengmaiensis TaxID=3040919 RepID=A0ABT6HHJ1_9ACTN|nr:hypothetical protein [Streptomyces chengmaiensis]MDH2387811.1 hypothetical protein [Streptomyces chengmaiensis]